MINKKIILGIFAMLFMLFIACMNDRDDLQYSNKDFEKVAEERKSEDIQKMKSFLVSEYGFSKENIRTDEGMQVFIAEGCMRFDMNDFWEKYKYPKHNMSSSNSAMTARNTITHYSVSPSYRKILVEIYDEEVPRGWVYAVEDAVNAWNRLGGGISFTMNPSEVYNSKILVFYRRLEPQLLAIANFPTVDGRPGKSIIINSAPANPVSNMYHMAHTICHELGHCIGFHHTDLVGDKGADWKYFKVEGCEGSDFYSVMQANFLAAAVLREMFSECDEKTYHKLYP